MGGIGRLMVFSPQSKTSTKQRQDNDKTNVEPVHSYDAFYTTSANDGMKGIIGKTTWKFLVFSIIRSLFGAIFSKNVAKEGR